LHVGSAVMSIGQYGCTLPVMVQLSFRLVCRLRTLMKTLLLIEDTAELRNEMAQLLEWEGYQTLLAANATAGIQLAQTHHPDLILCDIMMPGMDGYETMTAIRQEPALAAIPFIFVTAKSSLEERRRGLAFGACAYLTKPFTSDELSAAIARCLD